MMKKTIYVHIGPHKTGTTTIQRNLFANEEMLYGAGILCPQTGRAFPLSAGNHNLVWELRRNFDNRFDSQKGTWYDLLNELEATECSRIILSSEDFSLLDQFQIKSLQQITEDYNVKIIMYLRRQDEALQSTWVQLVKFSKAVLKIGSFFNWIEKNNCTAGNVEYLKIIKKWESVFSKENIILQVLNPSHHKGTLFSDFLLLCNISIKSLTEVPNANVSPGVKTIEAIRLIKENVNFSNVSTKQLGYFINNMIKFGNANGWNQEKLNYLSKNLSNSIMNRHKQSNHIIAKEYFNGNEYLFEKTRKTSEPITSFTYSNFSKEELITIYTFIIELFEHRLKAHDHYRLQIIP